MIGAGSEPAAGRIQVGCKLAALRRCHQTPDAGAMAVGADAQQRIGAGVGWPPRLTGPAGVKTVLEVP
jgi:hypothetical protein